MSHIDSKKYCFKDRQGVSISCGAFRHIIEIIYYTYLHRLYLSPFKDNYVSF